MAKLGCIDIDGIFTCPKCGELPDIRRDTDSGKEVAKRNKIWAECGCGIRTKMFFSEEAFKEWWNKRA